MKKCLKCNLEFDDETNFCPKCGGKLMSKNVCPKCGKPIEPGDSFCRHCGAKLEKVTFCPNCHSKCPDGAKFCPNCGTKTANGIVSTNGNVQAEVNSTNSVGSVRKAFSIVALVLSSLAALFFIAGVFGDFFVANNVSYGIKYFFVDGPKNIRDALTWGVNKDFYKFQMTTFVVQCFLYFGGLASSLTLVGVSIYKNVKSFKMSKSFNFNTLKTAGLLAFIFPIYWMLTNYVRTSYGSVILVSARFGWGAALIIAGLSCVFVADVFNGVLDPVEKKEPWTNFIFNHTISLFLLLFLFVGFTSTTGLKVSEEAMYYQPYLALYRTFYLSSSTAFFDSERFGLSMCAFIMALIALAIVAELWCYGKKMNKIAGIVLSSMLVVVLIVDMVVGGKGILKDSGAPADYLTFGAGSIFALVAAIFLIGLYICLTAVKEKPRAQVNIE